MKAGAKWPFAPKTELDTDTTKQNLTAAPTIAPNRTRIYEVTQVPAGNYDNIALDGQRVYYVSRESRFAGGNSI